MLIEVVACLLLIHAFSHPLRILLPQSLLGDNLLLLITATSRTRTVKLLPEYHLDS